MNRRDERPPAVRTIQERNALLDAHNAKLLIDLAHDTGDERPIGRLRHALTKPGDERQLRGIPVIGAPGVGGHIAGTRP